MKKTAAMLTAIILVQVLVAFVMVLPAHAEGDAMMSGAVYADANANGMLEPGEVNLANATVYLKSEIDSSVQFTATTAADGYYILSNIPYGRYIAWAITAEGGMAPLSIVELGEVNAAVTIDFAVIDNSDDIELMGLMANRLLLPLVTR